MGFFDMDNKDFFGGLFDINRDGKTDLFEQSVAFKIMDESMKNSKDKKEKNPDTRQTTPEYEPAYKQHSWREKYETDLDYVLDPEDYDTEEEYLEAVQEEEPLLLRTETKESEDWREKYEFDFDHETDPEDFETEEEYLEAVEQEDHVWRDKYFDLGIGIAANPDDYDSERDFVGVLIDERSGLDDEEDWQDNYSWDPDVGIDPYDYEDEMEFLEDLYDALDD